MRFKEFSKTLVEASTIPAPEPVTPIEPRAMPPKPMSKPKAISNPAAKPMDNPNPVGEGKPVSKEQVLNVLKQAGYEDLKITGNKINVLVQIPDGQKKNQFRKETLEELLAKAKANLSQYDPQFSGDPGLSSLGGIVFDNSPISIVVKDVGKQGDKSAGVANEIELASIIKSVVEEYGFANVTFVDDRGKKLTLKNCNEVIVAGRDTADRKKADVELVSGKSRLPISIKKLDADMWESADNMFGERARKILDKLVKTGVVELKKIGTRNLKTGPVNVYELSKEIVMEPTPEEALNAIFGSDLNPQGGVVIQTFKPEHFTQDKNNVTVHAHAVITNFADIPETHLMVWLLRNDSTRNGGTLGIAGIRPLGVTLTRGIGKRGDKDVVLVDKDGNLVKRNKKS
jgi:hypothetical protein